MKKPLKVGDFSVQAISGTHSIIFGIDVQPAGRANLKGFAIRVKHPGADQGYWQRGFKFFESLVPHPKPGERHSTLEHPIQDFVWGEYGVAPGNQYECTIRPLYGAPGSLTAGPDLQLSVSTEAVDRGKHAIFFNRGAIPSQKFADEFGNRGPADENDVAAEDVRWLSRGLLEGALQFIGQARGSRFELRVAAYELTYRPILEAFIQAAASGAKVQIVYEAGKEKVKGVLKETSTTTGNKQAIKDIHLDDQSNIQLIRRTKRAAIPHNKFIILIENGYPVQVWTGSTNFTSSGFLGQTNVGHWVRDEGVAKAYLDYWNKLSKNPDPETFQLWCSQHSPDLADGLPPAGITPIFSPRQSSKMLKWYGERLEKAGQAVMFTAAFGVTAQLAKRFDNDRDFLRYLLMEKDVTDPVVKTMLYRDWDTRIALGAELNKDAIKLGLDGHRLDEWFMHEEHFRRKGHIFYVHTKIMMLDALGSDPLIFSGSANFSPPSLLSNDENMLLIRGDKTVADIYVTEFMRLFNHFYFRYIAQKLAKENKNQPSKAAFLDPTDKWVERYFKSSTQSNKERELFRAP
jgi:phosphatidylserine/phosphatidylglycerophosphate/cardiolipin synthase-like enzyme